MSTRADTVPTTITPGTSHAVPPSESRPPRILSCTLCAQRRVKCDKKQPCGNCIKAGVECISSVPSRSRRRRRRAADSTVDDLLARCKRYERLLLSYGATKDLLDNDDDDTSRTVRNSDLTPPSVAESTSSSSPHLAGLPGKKYVICLRHLIEH